MNQSLFIWIIFLTFNIHAIQCGKYEKALLSYLFDQGKRNQSHNILERPSANDSASLDVQMKISLVQIIDVDEKNQILTTCIWLTISWNDYMMKWDSLKFGNITSITIDPKKIWRPDILMYNSANEKFDSAFPTNVVVNHDGNILYAPPGMFKSTCSIQIAHFPFDRQSCEIKFGSWTYDRAYIDLKIYCEENDPNPKCFEEGKVVIDEYIPNGEWGLLGVPAKRNSIKYDCCPEEYVDIKIFVNIQRRSLYYTFNLIIPCILISIIALLVFTLPPDAGEKIGLGVTIVLSLTMFLLLVAEHMPQTSDAIPLIGIYFSCIMFMSSISVVFTVLVLNYHHRAGEDEIPKWIRIYVNDWLAQLLMMKPRKTEQEPVAPEVAEVGIGGGPELDPSRQPIKKMRRTLGNPGLAREVGGGSIRNGPARESSFHGGGHSGGVVVGGAQAATVGCRLYKVGKKDRGSKSLLANVLDLEDDFRLPPGVTAPPSYSNVVDGDKGLPNHGTTPTGGAGSIPFCTTKKELTSILRELRVITCKIKDNEKDDEVTKQWKFAAQVIDRACLVFCSVFTIIATLAILPSASTLWDGVQPIK